MQRKKYNNSLDRTICPIYQGRARRTASLFFPRLREARHSSWRHNWLRSCRGCWATRRLHGSLSNRRETRAVSQTRRLLEFYGYEYSVPLRCPATSSALLQCRSAPFTFEKHLSSLPPALFRHPQVLLRLGDPGNQERQFYPMRLSVLCPARSQHRPSGKESQSFARWDLGRRFKIARERAGCRGHYAPRTAPTAAKYHTPAAKKEMRGDAKEKKG